MSRTKPKRAPQRAAAPTPRQRELVVRSTPAHGGPPEVTLSPEGVRAVERMAAAGCGQRAIATRLGIGERTLKRLIEKDDVVRDAWTSGLGAEEAHLVGNLRRLADKGNIVANLFLLKTRHGFRENDPVAPTHTAGIVITLPAAMSHEQWEAHRAQQRTLAASTDVVDVESREVTDVK
jgi:hypothetical protein